MLISNVSVQWTGHLPATSISFAFWFLAVMKNTASALRIGQSSNKTGIA